ncbi:hypothetical protein [Streptomyces sp. NPDC059783]|uniref:hypothetical protein n=1 Tax=Streptomyces sp. NPDC059783 TaxID=3346944 RepID=UPI003652827A
MGTTSQAADRHCDDFKESSMNPAEQARPPESTEDSTRTPSSATDAPRGLAIDIEVARRTLYACDPVIIADTSWHIDPYGIEWSHDVTLRFVVDELGWQALESIPLGQALVREALEGRVQWPSARTARVQKLAAKWRADHPGEDPTDEAMTWAFNRIAGAPSTDLYPAIRAEIQTQKARQNQSSNDD